MQEQEQEQEQELPGKGSSQKLEKGHHRLTPCDFFDQTTQSERQLALSAKTILSDMTAR